MVCDRCIRVVREELSNAGYDVRNVDLGEAEIGKILETKDIEKIKVLLFENGFELIEDANAKTIDAIKRAVIKLVQLNNFGSPAKLKYSEYLSKEVRRDYHFLSTLFSSVENVTIERYIILQRIERTKELIKYGELSFSEIAFHLGYSSVQHLSNQFKSLTGFTPSEFKRQTTLSRRPIDRVK